MRTFKFEKQKQYIRRVPLSRINAEFKKQLNNYHAASQQFKRKVH